MNFSKVLKENPYHDPQGRFCTAEKAKGASVVHPRQVEHLHRQLGVGAWARKTPKK
jgi:hypothetical protein